MKPIALSTIATPVRVECHHIDTFFVLWKIEPQTAIALLWQQLPIAMPQLPTHIATDSDMGCIRNRLAPLHHLLARERTII